MNYQRGLISSLNYAILSTSLFSYNSRNMGTVVKRHTPRKTGQRRSHHAVKQTTVVQTGKAAPRLPHTVNTTTGEYRGRIVKSVAKKAARNTRRLAKKAAK